MTTATVPKNRFSDVLNALDEMQQSIAYAARRHVLCQAEQIIVELDEERRTLRLEVEALRQARDAATDAIAAMRGDNYTPVDCGGPTDGLSL